MAKKLNNAETIRTLLEIEKKCIENGEEEIFTPNFRNCMEEIIKEGTIDGKQNDMLVNALLQKKLVSKVPKITVK